MNQCGVLLLKFRSRLPNRSSEMRQGVHDSAGSRLFDGLIQSLQQHVVRTKSEFATQLLMFGFAVSAAFARMASAMSRALWRVPEFVSPCASDAKARRLRKMVCFTGLQLDGEAGVRCAGEGLPGHCEGSFSSQNGRGGCDYSGQYWAIFFFRNSTLRASCSMPSTPSSMLIQPLKPLLFSSVKIAS